MNDKRKLLKKFIDGQCTEQEQQTVRMLLDTAEGKALLYEMMAAEEDGVEEQVSHWEEETTSPDKVQAWKGNVLQRIQADGEHINRPVRKLNVLRYAAMWAGILLVSGLVFWQLKKITLPSDGIAYIKKENRQGAPVRYLLPDSTEVYLAAGSTLFYPEKYPDDGRDVNLEGEAFFDVTHDRERPFIIHTGNMQTRVLGTSFKVTAFGGEPMQVAVATGKVSVSDHSVSGRHELAKLAPGMKIEVDSKTGNASVGKVDVYSLEQWKSGDIVFDQQPLQLVAAELQRRYGITIHCKDAETAAYRVSGTFPATETATQVIKVLSVLGQFHYKVQENQTYNLYKTEQHMQQDD